MIFVIFINIFYKSESNQAENTIVPDYVGEILPKNDEKDIE